MNLADKVRLAERVEKACHASMTAKQIAMYTIELMLCLNVKHPSCDPHCKRYLRGWAPCPESCELMPQKTGLSPATRFPEWAQEAHKHWGGLSSREREIAHDAWIAATLVPSAEDDGMALAWNAAIEQAAQVAERDQLVYSCCQNGCRLAEAIRKERLPKGRTIPSATPSAATDTTGATPRTDAIRTVGAGGQCKDWKEERVAALALCRQLERELHRMSQLYYQTHGVLEGYRKNSTQPSASIPSEATPEMIAAVGTILQPYAAKLVWKRMMEVASTRLDPK